jgi:hypothetical protein
MSKDNSSTEVARTTPICSRKWHCTEIIDSRRNIHILSLSSIKPCHRWGSGRCARYNVKEHDGIFLLTFKHAQLVPSTSPDVMRSRPMFGLRAPDHRQYLRGTMTALFSDDPIVGSAAEGHPHPPLSRGQQNQMCLPRSARRRGLANSVDDNVLLRFTVIRDTQEILEVIATRQFVLVPFFFLLSVATCVPPTRCESDTPVLQRFLKFTSIKCFESKVLRWPLDPIAMLSLCLYGQPEFASY